MSINRGAIQRRLKEKKQILKKTSEANSKPGAAKLAPAIRRRLLSDKAPSQGPQRYSFQEK